MNPIDVVIQFIIGLINTPIILLNQLIDAITTFLSQVFGGGMMG